MNEKQEAVLCSPLKGRVVPLDEVADEAFAQGVLGDGVAVCPTEGVLCAPADGRVGQLFESRHALTYLVDGGAELLLHIGLDTVALKGAPFTVKVREGQRCARGEGLVVFDIGAIRAAGYDVTTPMIVSNSEDYTLEVLARGEVDVGVPLLCLRRKEAKK